MDFGAECGRRSTGEVSGDPKFIELNCSDLLPPASAMRPRNIYLFHWMVSRIESSILKYDIERPCGIWLDCSTLGRNNEEVEGENLGEGIQNL